MNSWIDEILADYNDAELELLAGFLQKVTAAGVIAAALSHGDSIRRSDSMPAHLHIAAVAPCGRETALCHHLRCREVVVGSFAFRHRFLYGSALREKVRAGRGRLRVKGEEAPKTAGKPHEYRVGKLVNPFGPLALYIECRERAGICAR